MDETIISKPIHKILAELTGEERFDVALHLATKDLVRLKLQEARNRVKNFTHRYGMTFEEFREAWEQGRIDPKYDYDVEKDYWEWEAAETDVVRLEAMLEKLS